MTTTLPEDHWASVPSLEEAFTPDAATRAEASPSGEGLRGQRRTLFKTAMVLGGALALNVLSWLPPNRAKPASARVGTEFGDCNIYSYADNITCTGAPYSRDYCGNDGWFLQYSGTCFSSGAITACNQRNAWRWKRGTTWYRCADGMQYWCGGSAFRICSWSNP